MADLEGATEPLGGLHQLDAAGEGVGHGLFQQYVIAGGHGGGGRFHVHPVLGGHDGALAELTGGEQFLPGGETVSRVDVVVGGEAGPALRVGLGHGDEADLLRVAQGVGRIGELPAIPCADEDEFHWFGHDHRLRYAICKTPGIRAPGHRFNLW